MGKEFETLITCLPLHSIIYDNCKLPQVIIFGFKVELSKFVTVIYLLSPVQAFSLLVYSCY